MSSSTNPPSRESNKPSAPELRQDLVTGQWVIIAEQRARRPQSRLLPAELPPVRHCPFCHGNEQETPPPVASYPPPGGGAQADAWQLRVVPNLYPALLTNAAWPPSRGAATAGLPARGWHEVVIESPNHLQRLTDLDPEQATLVLQAYRDRLRVFATDACMVCGFAFKNCGRDAGMSLEHIHSQLVALPFLPPVLELELRGARKFWDQSGQCVFCYLSSSELQQQSRVVAQTDHFLAICPFASRAAYETWILPRFHEPRFEHIAAELLAELALLLQDILGRLEACLVHPAYNYVLHSSPFDTHSVDHYHWHFEIIPRIAHLAGLEWGTGVHINIVSPEAAARSLRETR